jgi:hypothetical protein
MTLQSAKLICESVCLLALGFAGCYTAWKVGAATDKFTADQHATQSLVQNESRDITIALLRPCKPGPCGLIPGVAQTTADTGAAVRTMQQQVAQTQPLITAAANGINGMTAKVGTAMDAFTGTANAGTQAVLQARTDLQTLNGSIAATRPLLTNLSASSGHLDAFLKGEMLTKTLPAIAMNVQKATGNVELTTADIRSQVYKWTHPGKKKITFWTATEAGGDYARHFMPSIF